MGEKNAIIGIDIGGTKISAALFDIHGDILCKERTEVAGNGGIQVIKEIARLANSLMLFSKENNMKVHSIGACVPGIYDPVKKTAWAPNIRGWDHISLGERLSELIEDDSVRVTIESDRSCYILGEFWQGCAKECTDAIFIAVGTGIGAGILSNNKIISGRSGIAGAISWMALEPPYQRKYDPWGNLEHYASGNGIARSAIELLQHYRNEVSSLDSLSTDKITSQDVFNAFEQGDSLAEKVMEKAIKYWGMASANMISIFNPQKIIFGGGVFGPAAQFMDRIRSEAQQWAQPLSMKEVSFEVTTLEGDAGLIGAGYLALMNLNEDTHA